MSIQLRFLGTPEIKAGDCEVTTELDNKYIGLLAYLAVERKRCARPKLVELFWGGKPEEKAQASLRQAIYEINTLLHHVLLADRRFVSLDETAVNADVWELVEASEQKRFKQVAELYRGEFLGGLLLDDSTSFEEWQREQRARFHGMATEALERLLIQADEQRALESVLLYARRLVALEPLREAAYRSLMLALGRKGRFSEALAVYNECTATLQRELGITPAAETQAVYERIRLARNRLRKNLPATTGAFVGRERELIETTHSLKQPDCRLLTLVGIGGIGKTRVALKLAELVQHNFLEGAIFVPLQYVQSISFPEDRPETVAERLATSIINQIGLTPTAEGDLTAFLLNHLRNKEMLIVLDSFEQLLTKTDSTGSRALVADILEHAPDVKLLVTSRERLNLRAEQLFILEGLPYPRSEEMAKVVSAEQYSSIQLFNAVALRVNPRFSLTRERFAVGQICLLLEGVPLGIELAASLIGERSSHDTLVMIQANLGALAVDMPDVPRRQHSLRATFDYSWSSLTEREQQLFAMLSLFVGSFSLSAAQDVTQGTKQDLDRLVHISFVKQVGERYDIHSLLRHYGLTKLEELSLEKEAAEERFCNHFTKFLQEKNLLSNQDSNRFIADVEQELDNTRKAWRLAATFGNARQINEMIAGLFRFYQSRSLFQEAKEIARETYHLLRPITGLESNEREMNQLVLGKLLTKQAAFSWITNEPEEALTVGEEALAIFHSLGNQEEASKLIGTLAIAAQNLGYNEKAGQLYQEHLDICKEINWSSPETVQVLINMGLLYRTLGKYHEAEALFQQSVAVARSIQHPRGEAYGLGCQGVVYCDFGAYEKAKQFCQQSIDKLKEIGDQYGLGISLSYMALTLCYSGDNSSARQHAEEAIRTLEPIASNSAIPYALLYLGEIHHAVGEYEKARQLYERSGAVFKEAQISTQLAICLHRLGSVSYDQEKHEQAIEYFNQSLDLARKYGGEQNKAWALCGVASILNETNQFALSVQHFREALQIARYTRLVPLMAEILVQIADVFAKHQLYEKSLVITMSLLEDKSIKQQTKDKAESILQRIEAKLSFVKRRSTPSNNQTSSIENVLIELLELPRWWQ